MALRGLVRETALKSIPTWKEVTTGRDAITRTYKFADFKTAFYSFMTRVAEVAEKNNHHPEWFNVYNRVDVVLATHDDNGVTQKDIILAKEMDKIALELGATE